MPVLQDGGLILYGYVGETFFDEGFTDREVLDALDVIGREANVDVRINSGGGYTDHGAAIFNALKAHKGKVTVYVDGIAASAASLIAMGGDEIIMRTGALMMIHDPMGRTQGNAADHSKSVEMLTKEAEAMASIYAERTGKTAAEMRAIMIEETWFTAENAVAAGFATRADSAQAKTVSAFDYRTYAHAPAPLVALASKKDWSRPAADHQASPDQLGPQHTPGSGASQTERMVAEAAAKAVAAFKGRQSAILGLPEADGRETLARHLINTTEMDVEEVRSILAVANAERAAPVGGQADDAKSYVARVTLYVAPAPLCVRRGGNNRPSIC